MTGEDDNAPSFTSDATARVAENLTLAYTATATDADGSTLTYSLSGGADAALFTIDATTGEVSFNTPPDFEAPGSADEDNVYEIMVTASDGVNETEQAVAITVTNVNDNNPVFTSPDAAEAAENQRLAYTAAATDADGDALSYSLSGSDAGLFTIDGTTGEISFRTAPDFENPGDANGDNVYDIIIMATDGANETPQAVAVTVTNVDDNSPSFSSDATVSVAENETPAYTAMATDADGSTLTYSLSGGADAALFTIDGTTGQVSFNTPPDFEAPGSADGDNDYEIMVTVSDGVTTDATLPVTITVSNINDNDPAFTSPATAGVAENSYRPTRPWRGTRMATR